METKTETEYTYMMVFDTYTVFKYDDKWYRVDHDKYGVYSLKQVMKGVAFIHSDTITEKCPTYRTYMPTIESNYGYDGSIYTGTVVVRVRGNDFMQYATEM